MSIKEIGIKSTTPDFNHLTTPQIAKSPIERFSSIKKSAFLVLQFCLSTIDSSESKFLDNFPYSTHVEDAYDMGILLRSRISKKHYETARLYLKMKKFDSSFYYLDMVLSDYYDTKYYDEAIITYMFTYIVMDDYNQAKIYFESNKDNFKSNKKLEEAENMLLEYSNGIGLSGYFRLYR